MAGGGDMHGRACVAGGHAWQGEVANGIFENNIAVHLVKFAADTSNSGLGSDCGIGLGWIRNKN